MIHLDTHVVVWLFAGRGDLFPPTALARLEADELRVSPVVLLELQYLHEIGRIATPGEEVTTQLAAQIGLTICDLPFATVVARAARQSWTRDPFDRLIVGHAAAAGCALQTKDDTIRRHYPRAVWD